MRDRPRSIVLVLAPDYPAACDWATRNGIRLARWQQLTRTYQLAGYGGPIVRVDGAEQRPDYSDLISAVRVAALDVIPAA